MEGRTICMCRIDCPLCSPSGVPKPTTLHHARCGTPVPRPCQVSASLAWESAGLRASGPRGFLVAADYDQWLTRVHGPRGETGKNAVCKTLVFYSTGQSTPSSRPEGVFGSSPSSRGRGFAGVGWPRLHWVGGRARKSLHRAPAGQQPAAAIDVESSTTASSAPSANPAPVADWTVGRAPGPPGGCSHHVRQKPWLRRGVQSRCSSNPLNLPRVTC
jgi:hypothetical protein